MQSVYVVIESRRVPGSNDREPAVGTLAGAFEDPASAMFLASTCSKGPDLCFLVEQWEMEPALVPPSQFPAAVAALHPLARWVYLGGNCLFSWNTDDAMGKASAEASWPEFPEVLPPAPNVYIPKTMEEAEALPRAGRLPAVDAMAVVTAIQTAEWKRTRDLGEAYEAAQEAYRKVFACRGIRTGSEYEDEGDATKEMRAGWFPIYHRGGRMVEVRMPFADGTGTEITTGKSEAEGKPADPKGSAKYDQVIRSVLRIISGTTEENAEAAAKLMARAYVDDIVGSILRKDLMIANGSADAIAKAKAKAGRVREMLNLAGDNIRDRASTPEGDVEALADGWTVVDRIENKILECKVPFGVGVERDPEPAKAKRMAEAEAERERLAAAVDADHAAKTVNGLGVPPGLLGDPASANYSAAKAEARASADANFDKCIRELDEAGAEPADPLPGPSVPELLELLGLKKVPTPEGEEPKPWDLYTMTETEEDREARAERMGPPDWKASGLMTETEEEREARAKLAEQAENATRDDLLRAAYENEHKGDPIRGEYAAEAERLRIRKGIGLPDETKAEETADSLFAKALGQGLGIKPE